MLFFVSGPLIVVPWFVGWGEFGFEECLRVVKVWEKSWR